jgi:glycosyltransferase involved in cell wall biosynthesis
MPKAGPVRVVADASALADNRATAGIGRYARSLIEELRQRDDVRLWTATPRWPPPREAWAVRFAWSQPLVAPLAVLHRADLVHGLASDPVLFWPLRRQVVTLHDVLPWTMVLRAGRITPRYLAMQRRRLLGCGAVIAVSQATADEGVEVLGLDPARVHVVPEAMAAAFSAVEEPDDTERRRAVDVAEGPYLLWVGSMRAHDPRKGLDGILEALGSLRHPGVPLVLVGARGAESERVATAAASLGIEMVQTGFVADATLAALYRGATAVLLPSHHEGFGLTALEAMGCGAPLIAARSANLPLLVGDGALLVTPGSSSALAGAIDAVMGEPEVAARLRERGPAVAAQYSWKRTAELTVEVYRAVLSNL